jgi:hypothetical protein
MGSLAIHYTLNSIGGATEGNPSHGTALLRSLGTERGDQEYKSILDLFSYFRPNFIVRHLY